MNTLKATLIIIVTLIAGIIMGIMMGGWFSDKKLKAFMEYRTEDGFRRVALEVLDPDDEQKDEILPIINEYASLNRDLNYSYRQDLEALQLAYWGELQPYLNEAQVNKLVGSPGDNKQRNESRRKRPARPEGRRDSSDFRPDHPPRDRRPHDDIEAFPPDSFDRAFPGDDSNFTHVPPPPPPEEHGLEPGPDQMPGPVEKAERFSLMMKRQLLLDDDQYQAVRKINLDHSLQMKSIHEKYRKQPKRGMMQEISILNEERDVQVQEILTEPQIRKYTVMMERMKRAWVNKQGRRR